MANINIPGTNKSVSVDPGLHGRALRLAQDYFKARRERIAKRFPLCRFRYSHRFYEAHRHQLNKPAVRTLRKLMVIYSCAADEAVKILQELVSGRDAHALRYALVEGHRNMHALNKIAIECATCLAPYETPKLGRIEEKSEQVHRYVVKTPFNYLQAPPVSSEAWLKQALNKQIAPPAR